jgi:hypothetical protein
MITLNFPDKQRRFALKETEIKCDNYERDVCDTCCKKGLGKYLFDEKTQLCGFADICASDFMGNSDRVYPAEI